MDVHSKCNICLYIYAEKIYAYEESEKVIMVDIKWEKYDKIWMDKKLKWPW